MLNDQGLQQGIPATIAAAASGVGVANSAPFTFPPSIKTGQDRNVQYLSTGAYTVCTANLEESFDGGVTWVAMQKAIDLAANPGGTFTPLAGGAKYRLNIQTFTGTSITVAVILA